MTHWRYRGWSRVHSTSAIVALIDIWIDSNFFFWGGGWLGLAVLSSWCSILLETAFVRTRCSPYILWLLGSSPQTVIVVLYPRPRSRTSVRTTLCPPYLQTLLYVVQKCKRIKECRPIGYSICRIMFTLGHKLWTMFSSLFSREVVCPTKCLLVLMERVIMLIK